MGSPPHILLVLHGVSEGIDLIDLLIVYCLPSLETRHIKKYFHQTARSAFNFSAQPAIPAKSLALFCNYSAF
jgi:hypothetical protein